MKREEALTSIVNQCVNSKVGYHREQGKLDIDIEKASLLFLLMDEGNNCMMLSKYFGNVLVRFDSNYQIEYEEDGVNKKRNMRNVFRRHHDFQALNDATAD